MAKYLIEEGADVNGIDQNKPIYAACETGDLKIVEFLLPYNPDFTNCIAKCLRGSSDDIAKFLARNGVLWETEIFDDFSYLISLLGFNIIKSSDISKIYNFKIFDYYLSLKSINSNSQSANNLKDREQLTQQIINENTAKDTIKIFNLLKIKHTYRNDKFILTTQISGYEFGEEGTNIKMRSRTYINDKKLYMKRIDKLIDDYYGRYVVDKTGELYVPPHYQENIKHSSILRGIKGKTKLGDISLYGYGKPVASAGYITIVDGEIKDINNNSGHYRTGVEQFKIVCKHLYDVGLLTKNTTVQVYDEIEQTCVRIDIDLETLNIGEILDQYPSL